MPGTLRAIVPVLALAGVVATLHAQQPPARPDSREPAFRFKSGVELINVTATVSDANGRFVPDLTRSDFSVYEDEELQAISHFSAERVPVSLGILLDTSGSMAGEKIEAARSALNRFFSELVDRDDEFLLYRFSNAPMLIEDWTSDRPLLSRVLGRVVPNGGTALYDAVAESVPRVEQARNRKKALLIISDGNDTASETDVRQLKRTIRESEVLVYAIGIDGESEPSFRPQAQPPRPRGPGPTPFPFPFPPGGPSGPGRGGRPRWPSLAQFGGGQFPRPQQGDDRVNASALRDLTDESGGRTEIVRDARDLGPATASIADELSKQDHLGYPATGKKDGQWHSIRVEVNNRSYHVRARRGYVAN